MAQGIYESFKSAVAERDDKKIFHLAAQRDFNTNYKDNGEPLIIYAVNQGYMSTVQALANNFKTNLNARNASTGVTALHWAATTQPEIGLYLLLRQADPSIKDNSGHYPLHYAAKSHSENAEMTAFMEALLKHPKVDIFAKNDGGRTAYEMAT